MALNRTDANDFEIYTVERWKQSGTRMIFQRVYPELIAVDAMGRAQKKTPAISFVAPTDFSNRTVAGGKIVESALDIEAEEYVTIGLTKASDDLSLPFAKRVAIASPGHYDIYPNGTFLDNYDPAAGKEINDLASCLEKLQNDLLELNLPESIVRHISSSTLLQFAYIGEPTHVAELPFNAVVKTVKGDDRLAEKGSFIKFQGGGFDFVERDTFLLTHGAPGAEKPFSETHTHLIAAGKPVVPPLTFISEYVDTLYTTVEIGLG